MRLDVALVCRLGLEDALDDVVGLLEPLLGVAMAELVPARDVGGLGLGAPGFIASSTSVTCGSISYFTSISLRALRATAALVAATAATAWPS